jgi:hypothetical protein
MKPYGRALAGLLASLAGCSSTATVATPPVVEEVDVTEAYRPQAVAHGECLVNTARSYAKMAGSPVELGMAGAVACSPTREELRVAVTRARGDDWAKGFMSRLTEEEDAKVIAQIVVDDRERRLGHG